MTLEIISPDTSIFSGEVSLVQVPGSKGSFEILNNHAPIISTLGPGQIKIVSADGKTTFFEIDGGVIESKGNKIIVLAEGAR